MTGKLYLMPTTLGETDWQLNMPANFPQIANSCKHFIVENVRTARRYLRKLDPVFDIDACEFYLIDKHTAYKQKLAYLDPALNGNNIAVISEAGCPGVADPGSDIVAMAHAKKIQVVPLVGPSSILLSIMASGLNGQNFSFHGYLPIQKPDRINKLKFLEGLSLKDGSTHLFIEAPYRNNSLLEDILTACNPGTMLCIAKNITLPDEFILTQAISLWKKKIPDLHKQTCMFLLNAKP